MVRRREVQDQTQQDARKPKRLGTDALGSSVGGTLGSTPILHFLMYPQVPQNQSWVRRWQYVCHLHSHLCHGVKNYYYWNNIRKLWDFYLLARVALYSKYLKIVQNLFHYSDIKINSEKLTFYTGNTKLSFSFHGERCQKRECRRLNYWWAGENMTWVLTTLTHLLSLRPCYHTPFAQVIWT